MNHTPEGHTILIEAPQREGKTLLAVILASDAHHQGRTIFSNLKLEIPHRLINHSELRLNEEKRFFNSYILIDEWNFWLDNRESMGRKNRQATRFLLQVKKQGAIVVGTTHSLLYLDRRVRENHDYILVPQVYPKFPAPPEILIWETFNGPTQKPFYSRQAIDCRPFLGLYDTTHTYDPFSDDSEDEATPRLQRRPHRRESRVIL